MREIHLKHLACPKCRWDLEITQIEEQNGNSIKTGRLSCLHCKSIYDIIRHVPRFVPLENYAASFGLEWNKHARTQYDSYTGTNISEKRFFGDTKWPRNMEGQKILEVGSGSGRFTEQAASTGAMVVSMDYSPAVDANYQSNGNKENVLIVQGDIYSMPFKEGSFDKLFCIGVLQHTPEVKKAFLALPKPLKPGGKLVIDVYRAPSWFITAHVARVLFKKVNKQLLYNICKKYVNFMWPIVTRINRLPKGNMINRFFFLIADYRGIYDLSEEILKEWAILDTFDSLTPAYTQAQRLETVKNWFDQAGLIYSEISYGGTGILGRGEVPSEY